MNEELEAFARSTIKAGLAKLPEKNHVIFKKMYANGNLDADINDVVDNMDGDKLNWAMQQVSRTIAKAEDAK